MAAFHFGVSMDKRPQEGWLYTVKLASGITDADISKAVTVDASAANQYKLAGDGDIVCGRLEVVEDNGLGTVALKFVEALPVKSGETIDLGDSVVGAGAGEVKAAAAADYTDNYVVEVRSGYVVVVKG